MVFGAAFLINDEIARGLSSADDISIQFGVSLPAARIYFEQMQEEIARPASSLRVLKIAEEVKAAIAPKESFSNKINFLNDPCLACGQQKVFPVGHKFMCQACDTVYDRFQDGDSVQ